MLSFRFLLCFSILSSAIACGGDDDAVDASLRDAAQDSQVEDAAGDRDVDDANLQDGDVQDGDEPDADGPDGDIEDASSGDGGGDDGGEGDASVDAQPDAAADTCSDHEECPDSLCFQGTDGVSRCAEPAGEPPRDGCDFDGCCESNADCDDGVCVAFTHMYCGGAAPPRMDLCRPNECGADNACAGDAACVPGSIWGGFRNRCAAGPCRTHSDCDEGGTCKIYQDGCGGAPEYFCAYPSDPCVRGSDCRGVDFPICVPEDDGQGTRCVSNPPRP